MNYSRLQATRGEESITQWGKEHGGKDIAGTLALVSVGVASLALLASAIVSLFLPIGGSLLIIIMYASIAPGLLALTVVTLLYVRLRSILKTACLCVVLAVLTIWVLKLLF